MSKWKDAKIVKFEKQKHGGNQFIVANIKATRISQGREFSESFHVVEHYDSFKEKWGELSTKEIDKRAAIMKDFQHLSLEELQKIHTTIMPQVVADQWRRVVKSHPGFSEPPTHHDATITTEEAK